MPRVLTKFKERISKIFKRKKITRICKICGFSDTAPFIDGRWAERDLCASCYDKQTCSGTGRRRFDGSE